MNINGVFDVLKAACDGRDPRLDFHFVKLLEENDTRITDKCLCGQPIKNNYLIKSETTKACKVVGSTCCKRFLPRAYREYQLTKVKKCAKCNKPNRCRLDEFCKECRGGVFKERLFGVTFRTCVRKFPKKAKFMLNRMPMSDFGVWLRREGGVVTVGKHIGYTGKEVYETDQGYARWVAGLSRPGEGLMAILNYMDEN